MQSLIQLIQQCVQGNARAEYQLYRHCHPWLMRVCLRYVTEATQASALLNEGFLKIMQSLSRFDPEKPFEAWARRIMVNTLLDYLRKEKRLHVHIAYQEEDSLPQGSVYSTADAKLDAADILKAIHRLPEPSRTVLNLYVFEEFSYKEIAEQLQLTEATCRWHLMKARNKLKAYLLKEEEFLALIR